MIFSIECCAAIISLGERLPHVRLCSHELVNWLIVIYPQLCGPLDAFVIHPSNCLVAFKYIRCWGVRYDLRLPYLMTRIN